MNRVKSGTEILLQIWVFLHSPHDGSQDRFIPKFYRSGYHHHIFFDRFMRRYSRRLQRESRKEEFFAA